MGGFPSPLSAVVSTFTHRSSDIRCTIVRRFFPYTVPHGPRKPIFIPPMRSAGGIFPSLFDQSWVWQSLHPATTVRYSPAFSIDSACTAGPWAGGIADAFAADAPLPAG